MTFADELVEFSKAWMRPALKPAKDRVVKALAHPRLRRLLSSNYGSGYLAFGEKNSYGISPRWVTLDMTDADFNHDFRTRSALPFADESQNAVFSSHVIEHLDSISLEYFIAEAARVLRKGGVIRLEAPDAELLWNKYRNQDKEFYHYFKEANREILCRQRGLPEVYAEEHIAFIGLLSCYIVDGAHRPVLASKEEVDSKVRAVDLEEFVEWCVSLQTPEQYRSGGHIAPIYFDKLNQLLSKNGFRDIRRLHGRETRLRTLRGIHRSDREFYSLYVEAVK